MKRDLLDLVRVLRLSYATIHNITMKLFWAFFYNTVGIPLAAGLLYPMFGIKLNPIFGAAAMRSSSICIVSNALRLRFFKPQAQIRKNAVLSQIESQKHLESRRIRV